MQGEEVLENLQDSGEPGLTMRHTLEVSRRGCISCRVLITHTRMHIQHCTRRGTGKPLEAVGACYLVVVMVSQCRHMSKLIEWCT